MQYWPDQRRLFKVTYLMSCILPQTRTGLQKTTSQTFNQYIVQYSLKQRKTKDVWLAQEM